LNKKDKIFSQIKQRVIQYLKIKGITQEKFFQETGISASNFKGSGAKSELGGEKIVSILTLYKDLSPEWLITGKGPIEKGYYTNLHDSLTDSKLQILEEPLQPNSLCKQCALRDVIINSQQETICLLKEKIDALSQKLSKGSDKQDNGDNIKQTA